MTFAKNIRVIIGLIFVCILVFAAFKGLKDSVPKYLAESKKTSSTEDGKVAGASAQNFSIASSKEDIQKQVNEIKGKILNLKPEDLKNNQAIDRILNDLQRLEQEVSQSAKVLDVKSNICEEAKKRFCE